MTKYKVTAETGFAEHKLGDEFEADLTDEQEQRYLERGSIEIVTKAKAKTTKKKEETDA
jgi:hypothetical protein